MQTPKSKARTLEMPKRKYPTATPKATRQVKPGPDADSLSSPNQASRVPKDGSPKVGQRRSPQSPISEKKRPSKMPDSSTQLAQLQEDLKKARDQVSASESSRRQAQQESEEAKRQVIATSAKLEEAQQQLQEISASDDDRILELRKLSHERDRAWQSELEAVQKQHEFDSSALASAMNEIQKLKVQLATASSESGTNTDIDETRTLVEKLKAEIFGSKESEARARETLSKTEMQLDIVNTTAEILRSENMKAKETLNSSLFELEQSKSRAQSLEELVNKLEEELDRTKCEAGQLKSALEAAEVRYQEEYIQSTMQIRNAYEQVELTKSEWSNKESQLVAELNAANTKIEDMNRTQNKLSEAEAELKSNLADLKERLMDKEMYLQEISQENEKLKMEIKKTEAEQTKGDQEAISSPELALTAEKEVLLKLAHLNAESERNSKRAALVSEQLDAAQAANTEMEAEMRRLKVQSDQWRKAAEAAAAILSSSGKIGERAGALDSAYIGMESSPFSEDKKNGNVLKKIGGLWKKGHP